MNKLQRLILLSVFAFLPLFLNSCVTTILIGTVLMIDHVCFHTESDGGTCGEIVYRIDFTLTRKRTMGVKTIPQNHLVAFFAIKILTTLKAFDAAKVGKKIWIIAVFVPYFAVPNKKRRIGYER